MEKEILYDLPQYYDIAFFWDNSVEINIYKKVYKNTVPFEVRNILEPACGTGRLLRKLPKYGYNVTGYDSNWNMLSYAKDKLINENLIKNIDLLAADMKEVRFRRYFDSAINSINSIGYILKDEDIIKHLKNTALSIKKYGVYIIQIACIWKDIKNSENNTWIFQRGNTKVTTTWLINREDIDKKISYQTCIMNVEKDGEKIEIRDDHIIRLWIYEDFKNLIEKSNLFELTSIYNEKGEDIPLNTDIIGEMGNLYYVLRVIE